MSESVGGSFVCARSVVRIGWRDGERCPGQISFRSRVAVVLPALGEKDKAFAVLNKRFENRNLGVRPGAFVDPRLDPLRDDPRFKELLRRVG